ncbi:flagellar biosynthesis regulator FlaF [Parvularcula dongshanensis]|uniref:Flagellar protein FlaF n=1 Tax=Parvularcula dongshanensis TaxID=1173995 RepID=A0A840I887_9PROT|nr:flagellar protein FlaF [Parvularcula dongshanensis]
MGQTAYSANPYAAAQRATLSGRALEREVLTRAALRIEAADEGVPGGASALAQALDGNRRLWAALATDIAASTNSCPDALKAQLLSLASFVERHTPRVMAGEAGREILVTINRNLAAGLAALERQAA